MKTLILFATTMLLSLTAFSQTDTTQICLPTTAARQIAIDLAKCDSVQLELTQTQKILRTTEHASYAKDTVITGLNAKIASQATQIVLYQAADKKQADLETKLQNDLNKAQNQAQFFKDGFTVASVVATVLGGVLWLVTR